MALNKKPYKGCRDFFPWDMRERDYIFKKMRSAAEIFAYEAYDGPLLEEVDLYKAKSGEELITDQIYSFIDRGDRNVAIRPEMTPTLARMIASIHKQESKPLRWYSIPNLMRYEKPQRGRVREHWQFNVDIFGGSPTLAEIEIISLAIHYLKSFGATSQMFQVLVNDRAIVDCVFYDLLKLKPETAYKLYKVIDNAKKITPEKLSLSIKEHLSKESEQKILHDYLSLKSFEEVADFLKTNNLSTKCENFLSFYQKVESLPIFEFLTYDPTIVRGLDYYTGIVFEIFDQHPENRRAIAGGGAYANLLGIFNEAELPGVGFGLGDVTMRDFLITHKLLPDLAKPSFDLILFYTDDSQESEAFSLAGKLRCLELKTELHLGKIKFNKIFKLAESKNYKFVGIIEMKDNKPQIQIKNIESKEGVFFEINEVDKMEDHLSKEQL